MKRNMDHVRIDLRTGRIFCEHCCDEYTMNMPVDLDIAIATTKVFGKKHKDCPKPPEVVAGYKL